MVTHILTKFHAEWIKTMPSRVYTWVFKVFELTCPNFGPSLDLIEIKILAKFHEDYIKTVPSEVYTCFF